jgi:hypothetical protein
MKLRHFVSGSAVVLGVWLAITFFHEVPSQRYPKLDKYRRSAEGADQADPRTATTGMEISQVSLSP